MGYIKVVPKKFFSYPLLLLCLCLTSFFLNNFSSRPLSLVGCVKTKTEAEGGKSRSKNDQSDDESKGRGEESPVGGKDDKEGGNEKTGKSFFRKVLNFLKNLFKKVYLYILRIFMSLFNVKKDTFIEKGWGENKDEEKKKNTRERATSTESDDLSGNENDDDGGGSGSGSKRRFVGVGASGRKSTQQKGESGHVDERTFIIFDH